MNYTYFIKNVIAFFFLANMVYANPNPQALNVEYEYYDNIFVWGCDYFNGKRGVKIKILGVTGGNGNYSVSVNGQGFAEPSSFSQGEGFVYFMTLSDISSNNIGFTISDTQNRSQNMDANVIALLSLFNFSNLCKAPVKCSQNIITHDEDVLIYADVYQATDKIISSGFIPERDISYFAPNEITLNIGFRSILVSNFTADIVTPCSD